jgi:hypothetical protein
LTPLGQSEAVIKVEDWAEIRRLNLSEHMGVKTIARRLGLARITDPDHVTMAAELRTAFQARTTAIRGPVAAPGTAVGHRALSHYDEVFNLGAAPPFPAAAPTLQVVR